MRKSNSIGFNDGIRYYWINTLNLNRKFIGFEKELETFEIAKARIRKYIVYNDATK